MCIEVENNQSTNNNISLKLFKDVDNNVKNIDPRTQIALDILRSAKPNPNSKDPADVIKLHKTARAGATTSLCNAAIEENKPFLLVAPTTKINEETIVVDVKKYSNKDAILINIPNNKKCLLNQEMIEDNPDFDELKWLPIGGICSDCAFYKECPVTEFLRAKKFNGVCLTYDKLAALQMVALMYPESAAAEIINKFDQTKVVILDEAHKLAFEKTTTIDLPETNKNIENLINKINLAHNNVDAAKADENKQFLTILSTVKKFLKFISNPVLIETKNKLKKEYLSDVDTNHIQKRHSITLYSNFKNNKIAYKRTTNKYTGENKLEIIDQTNAIKELMNEVLTLIPIRRKYDISMNEINSLFDMLDIDLSVQYSLSIDKDLKMSVTVIDHEYSEYLKHFTKAIQTVRQIILTSATFPNYDYNNYFYSGVKIIDVLFGENGDPFNTNSKMKIFCDTKKYCAIGRNSVKCQMDEIIKRCKNIFDIYGSENCLLICKNKVESEIISKRLKNENFCTNKQYYRSSDMMGVPSTLRVGILISTANIPTHSYDPVCDSLEDARILAEEDMQVNTYQALSRVKDPEGIEPSVVFALGCTEKDMENIISWGGDRETKIGETEIGKATEKNVTISGVKVSKPTLYTYDWKETLIQSSIHMNGYFTSVTFDFYRTEELMELSKDNFSVESKAELLNKVFEGTRYKTQFKYNNGGFSKKDVTINKKIITEYVLGNKIYFIRPILNKKTNFVLFEPESDLVLFKLKSFLDSNQIPHVVEKINNVYRTWIFVKETSISIAKKFIYSIIGKVEGIKVTLSDELILIPFGQNSKVLINGSFVDDFNYWGGFVDLSTFNSSLK